MLFLADVGKRFGSRTVLRRITLTVNAGSIALLTGANGAGKTTLLRLMAGLLAPDTGEIKRLCPEHAIAYLGHATFLYNGLTALENLAFWDRLCGGDGKKTRLMDALERAELTPFANTRAGIFSRGMAQRLNLARVLLLSPSLLLLDEPAAGLDTRSAAMLHREISAARKRGAAVVWITHDPSKDAELADTIFRIDKGTLSFSGTPAQWAQAKETVERGMLC